ncbi:hypothetical protein [Micromonospora aurantiaca (nom. illeg.)]|uniref:hypothetical protein n=1 Tax=Micromonospora aurantiaca (nom. illeg.) TaxID=47850 RepID=UPI003EB71D79
MSTPNELLARMQEQLQTENLEPAASSNELAQLSVMAMIRDAGGPMPSATPTLDVRMHGAGVIGHEVSLENAVAILNPLQQACASIGQSIAKVATAAGRIPEVIRRGTELRLSPVLSPGSLVFHLRAPAEAVTGEEIPGVTGSDTLADVTLTRLITVIRMADRTNEMLSISHEIRRFGPRAAKHLNDLAGAIADSEIDIDLKWRNGQDVRTALLNRRGALSLQDAINHNRTQTNTVTLTGVLVTASMVEPIAIRLDDDRLVHLVATPELATTLDELCFKRVVAQAEESITWRLGKGTEVRRYTLLSIHLTGS